LRLGRVGFEDGEAKRGHFERVLYDECVGE
jgi:hypothetical protein